jgi:hypothetical protein
MKVFTACDKLSPSQLLSLARGVMNCYPTLFTDRHYSKYEMCCVLEVFLFVKNKANGDLVKTIEWFETPNEALGGHKPIDWTRVGSRDELYYRIIAPVTLTFESEEPLTKDVRKVYEIRGYEVRTHWGTVLK